MTYPCVAGVYTDAWTSDNAADQRQAAELCQPCPILVACREGALERREMLGTWGGVTFRSPSSSLQCADGHCCRSAVGFGTRATRYGPALSLLCDLHLALVA